MYNIEYNVCNVYNFPLINDSCFHISTAMINDEIHLVINLMC